MNKKISYSDFIKFHPNGLSWKEARRSRVYYKYSPDDREMLFINYFDIESIRGHWGFTSIDYWERESVYSNSRSNLKTISWGNCGDDSEDPGDLVNRIYNFLRRICSSAAKHLPIMLEELKNSDSDEYISLALFSQDYIQIKCLMASKYFNGESFNLDKSSVEKFIETYDKAEEHNKSIKENAHEKHALLFSEIQKYPLTQEQINAAVTNEKRQLIIAAAGSGKTSSIIAKVAYLIESDLAAPEEILIMAFNKDAQVEINERLSRLSITRSDNKFNTVSVRTYHGLGMEIIASSERKPSICAMATSGEIQKSILFKRTIDNLCKNSNYFLSLFVDFVSINRLHLPQNESIKSIQDYNKYLEEIGGKWKVGSDGQRVVRLSAIDGTEVKSLEELRICNWLYLNGVEYEYERPYEYDTATKDRRQYYPDFYYPEADLYHEHFALGEDGLPPNYFSNYMEGVLWKRKTHLYKGTNLIETKSANFVDGGIFENLKNDLVRHGVTFKKRNQSELTEIVKNTFNPSRESKLFLAFLCHFKANNISIKELIDRASLFVDKTRSELFIKVFDLFFREYQEDMSRRSEIDFQDLINKARAYVEEAKFVHPYKYILIDEFQDISQDMSGLVKALLEQNESTNLFCVGDDWQSINRFSGADISIMKLFSNHFGSAQIDYLTKTFRFYQGLANVSSEFIQKNPAQLIKRIKSQNDIRKEQVIIHGYTSQEGQIDLLRKLLGKLNIMAGRKGVILSIFLLSRYRHQIDAFMALISSNNYSSLKLEFKTIHSSKGLEADYVLLLNVKSGEYSFPSRIVDDPLLTMVMPEPEEYPYAEERRLMYVALTRAKRATFILSDSSQVSPFVKELAQYDGVKTERHLL